MPGQACARALLFLGCASAFAHGCEGEQTEPPAADSETAAPEATGTPPSPHADVTNVEVSGTPGAYTFAVTVRSPDTGCEQYANWWEVLDEEGTLLYRRILGHSHVGEQPFTRSGGPVEVTQDARVFVRAHLFPSGYGGTTWSGSAADGFAVVDGLSPGFGDGVPDETPDCAH